MKTTSIVIFCITAFCLSAQNNSVILDHNNSAAFISEGGTFFYDFSDTNKGYQVPKNSNFESIFSAQFWFAGKDENNQIRMARGGQPSGNYDFFNGPISGAGNYSNSDYQSRWAMPIWKICQTEIDHFNLWWNCNNGSVVIGCDTVTSPSADLLQRIESWPATGDVAAGQSYYLAPFYDRNDDGVYSPLNDGDYPILKGCCGAYMIQNDAAESHTYSNTDSLGLEIHYQFYQYRTWDYLNNVTFIDVMAINRGTTNYHEFTHSFLVDGEIGNVFDDFFGVDSTFNCMYFYNADNFDEANFMTIGYGENPPALGIVSLRNPMSSSLVPFDPFMTSSTWNYMHGLQFGGEVMLNQSNNPTNFMFNGNPNVPSEWSMYSTSSIPNDYRGLASYQQGDFNVGDTMLQTYAIISARTGNHIENVQSVLDIASSLHTFYNTTNNPVCQNGTLSLWENGNAEFSIYPNPAKDHVTVSGIDNNLFGSTAILSELSGKRLFTLNISKSTIDFTLEGLAPGLYLMTIGDLTKRFVVE